MYNQQIHDNLFHSDDYAAENNITLKEGASSGMLIMPGGTLFKNSLGVSITVADSFGVQELDKINQMFAQIFSQLKTALSHHTISRHNVICFINTGRHWALGILDFEFSDQKHCTRVRLLIRDPLKTQTDTLPTVFSNLAGELQVLLTQYLHEQLTLAVSRVGNYVQQFNGYDCGPLTLENGLNAVAGLAPDGVYLVDMVQLLRKTHAERMNSFRCRLNQHFEFQHIVVEEQLPEKFVQIIQALYDFFHRHAAHVFTIKFKQFMQLLDGANSYQQSILVSQKLDALRREMKQILWAERGKDSSLDSLSQQMVTQDNTQFADSTGAAFRQYCGLNAAICLAKVAQRLLDEQLQAKLIEAILEADDAKLSSILAQCKMSSIIGNPKDKNVPISIAIQALNQDTNRNRVSVVLKIMLFTCKLFENSKEKNQFYEECMGMLEGEQSQKLVLQEITDFNARQLKLNALPRKANLAKSPVNTEKKVRKRALIHHLIAAIETCDVPAFKRHLSKVSDSCLLSQYNNSDAESVLTTAAKGDLEDSQRREILELIVFKIFMGAVRSQENLPTDEASVASAQKTWLEEHLSAVCLMKFYIVLKRDLLPKFQTMFSSSVSPEMMVSLKKSIEQVLFEELKRVIEAPEKKDVFYFEPLLAQADSLIFRIKDSAQDNLVDIAMFEYDQDESDEQKALVEAVLKKCIGNFDTAGKTVRCCELLREVWPKIKPSLDHYFKENQQYSENYKDFVKHYKLTDKNALALAGAPGEIEIPCPAKVVAGNKLSLTARAGDFSPGAPVAPCHFYAVPSSPKPLRTENASTEKSLPLALFPGSTSTP